MPISGLVVSLVEDRSLREQTLATIAQEPRIECGVVDGNRVAIVVDTDSSDDDKQIWNWLHDLVGVTFVDVALVAFEPDAFEPDTLEPDAFESNSLESNSLEPNSLEPSEAELDRVETKP